MQQCDHITGPICVLGLRLEGFKLEPIIGASGLSATTKEPKNEDGHQGLGLKAKDYADAQTKDSCACYKLQLLVSSLPLLEVLSLFCGLVRLKGKGSCSSLVFRCGQ